MKSRTIYRLAALLVLFAIGAHRLVTLRRPPGVDAYHEHVRQAAAAVPHAIGGWIGQDTRVPTQALSLLAPNAIISRHYTNVENGLSAGMLVVHCSDAHDMAGHFPLRCYPAEGWLRGGSRPRDWQVGDLKITGTEYQFYRLETIGHSSEKRSITVANCLLRPNGKVLRDMDALAASIVGAGGQALGAGQIQIYFDAGVPEQQRDEVIKTLIGGYRGMVDAILAPAGNSKS